MNIHRRVLEERGWKDVHRDINPNGNPFLFGISPDGFSLIAPAADANFAEKLLREMAAKIGPIPIRYFENHTEIWIEHNRLFGSGPKLIDATEISYLKFKGIELE